MLFCAPFAFKVSVEESVILMGLPLYVICFFLSYSLQYSFSVPVLIVLMIICYEEVLFWSSLFGVLKAFCN
jgi:hypothetical protein